MTYPIHPACAKWPHPSTAEFEALVADIKANGLLSPVWLTAANEILEGKVRYQACIQAGVEPRFETYRGDDPIGFTISHNKLRRHMSAAQLALIGEELTVLKHGSNQHQKKVDVLASTSTSETQMKIAEQLGISRELINDARALKKYAEPNVVELVRTNQVGIKNATTFARHTPREEQRNADVKNIKRQGTQLRSPLKNGINSKRMTAAVKTKSISTVKFSSEQCEELESKLRPLIERLRFQYKQHITLFCPFELECIAFDMNKFLIEWANAGMDAPLKASK